MDTGNFAWVGGTSESVRRHNGGNIVTPFDSVDVPSSLSGDGDIAGITGSGLATSARAVWLLTSPGTSFLGTLYRVFGLARVAHRSADGHTFYGVQLLSKRTTRPASIYVDANTNTGTATILRRSATARKRSISAPRPGPPRRPRAPRATWLLNGFGDLFASWAAPPSRCTAPPPTSPTLDVAAGSAYAVFVGSDSSGGMAQKVPLTVGSTYAPLTVPAPPSFAQRHLPRLRQRSGTSPAAAAASTSTTATR